MRYRRMMVFLVAGLICFFLLCTELYCGHRALLGRVEELTFPGARDDILGEWRFSIDPGCLGLSEGWYAPRYDAGDWKQIEVPSFWSKTWVGDYLGYGWYRNNIRIPRDKEGYDLEIQFRAVDEQGWIFVNGKYVGEHTIASEGAGIGTLWQTPFIRRIPAEYLNPGGQNLLAVLVHASTGQAGIWRPVNVRFVEKDAE